jgi:heme-degrading monooxygenase HmoA
MFADDYGDHDFGILPCLSHRVSERIVPAFASGNAARRQATLGIDHERTFGEVTIMIVRLWHGRVPNSKAAAYEEFLKGRAIPDYRSVPGNVSVHILERPEGEVTHFITMTFWESVAAIRAFAGEDIEKAKYYPEDEGFLLEYEPRVVHYDVVGRS